MPPSNLLPAECAGSVRDAAATFVAERADQPHVVLRVATLDDDPAVRPAAHIWTSHDVPWLTEGENLFPEWPPGR